MRPKISVLALLLCLWALPAHAQYQHASFFNGGTSLTATCTATTGTLVSSDIFLGTAQGNTTITLPSAATGCIDYDLIDIRYTQASSQAYTLTVAAGAGTALKILSNGGTLLAAPAGAASGAANVLHQVWVYNRVATTPQWDLVTQETNPSPSATGVLIPCGFPGATADLQITAAEAALPAEGGTVDTHCYGGTQQKIAATLTLGSSSKAVILKVDNTTQFQGTITNGTDVVDVNAGSAIIGDTVSQNATSAGFTPGFTLASNANVASVIHTVGSGAGYQIKNIRVSGNSTATVTTAAVWLDQPLQLVDFSGSTVGGFSGAGFASAYLVYVSNGASNGAIGPINMVNDQIDCNGNADCSVMLIKQTGTGGYTGSINIISGVYAHPGTGGASQAIIEARGSAAAPVFDVGLYGPVLESFNAGDIGLLASGAQFITADNVNCSAASTSGTDCIKLQSVGATMAYISLRNIFNFTGWTHTLNNVAAGYTRAGHIGSYFYTNQTGAWVVQDNTGSTTTIDANGVNSSQGPVTTKLLTFTGFLCANIATNLTANGMAGYCSDCNIANPCTCGGNGAIAKRLNGANVCN